MRFTEEQTQFRLAVRALTEEHVWPIAADLDATDRFPAELARVFGEQGLLQLWLPKEYGGPGGTMTKVCLAREEIAKASLAASVLCSNNSLGVILPLLRFGTEEQRRKFLPLCAQGTLIASTAMTEPLTGSDVASMQTSARRLPDGDYVLNGHKAWVTWAAHASYVLVFARTSAGPAHESISAFLVDPKTPGFTIGHKEVKMGRNGAPNYDVHLEDVLVPALHRVGEEGRGFKACMVILDIHRPTVAASSLGIAQSALDIASSYASKRRQFGKPVGQFQGMQFKLADMAMKIEAARALLYSAVEELDSGDMSRLSLLASMTKCHVSDVAMEVTTEAVQIMGAYGYSREYPVERFMRDAKINQLLEGTNEIHRMLIGKRLLDEAAANPAPLRRQVPPGVERASPTET
ncbi:acyl-CoA dehydrogenase [soil metagenome]